MSNDLNDLPLNMLNDVAWDRLTEQQALDFSRVLSLFNDAIDAAAVERATLWARASSFVMVCVIIGSMLTAFESTTVAVVCAVVLGASTLFSWRRSHAARHRVKACLRSLESFLVRLRDEQ